jgi:hypothetical protein
MHRLGRLRIGSLMGLVLVVNHCLCYLDKLLKFGNLEFEEVNSVLSGDLLNLERSGELERRTELFREGSETANDILRHVGSWLQPGLNVLKDD